MKTIVFVLFGASVLMAQSAATWSVNPVIAPASRGDQGPASQALLNAPWGVVADASGNVYIAESNAGVIRRVRASDGMIETFAGTGSQNDGIEGGVAVKTDLITPSLLLIDKTGALVFADTGACRIRKILSDGTIRNVAGSGHCAGTSRGGGFFGGGGVGRDAPALQTDLGHLNGMTLDPSGKIVFSESDLNLVRFIDSDGIVRILAGVGFAAFGGDGNLANAASLNSPGGLAYDAAGNLYIADSTNCRIRMVDSDANISTVAGNGNCPGRSRNFPTGTATRTSIGVVEGMIYEASTNSLLIASPSIARLLKFDLNMQQVGSILGSGSVGIPDFSKTQAQFTGNEINAVALAPGGGYIAAATTSFQVYTVNGDTVTSFAGRWPGPADLLRPTATCTRPDGTLIVVDTGTERLVSVDPATGNISLFAGADTPTGYSAGDKGLAIRATITNPKRVFCAATGEVYLTQSTFVRMIDNNGIITSPIATLAVGTTRTNLGTPVGIVIDSSGLLYYSDTTYHRVYTYNFSNAKTSIFAGTGIAGYSGDGASAISAQLYFPTDLALDGKGNLFIADIGNRVARVVRASTGFMQTVAGSTNDYTYSDITGQQATNIGFGFFNSIAADAAGNLYLAEPNRLTLVSPAGVATVLLGYVGESDSGVQYYRGQPLLGAGGVSVSPDGSGLYFTMNQTASLLALLAPQ